ncbi:MAG TPA: methyltransferase domain-containing protein [Stellaceae bacterium]|nr:methyltransferase domain-containing protein [Stellaceae bacterium]
MTRPESNRKKPRRLVLLDEQDKEAMKFFAMWLKSPTRIGAVVPSSRHLARAMAREVQGVGAGVIVELGAGTGSVTRALVEAGIPRERLVVVERDPDLYRLLKQHFPELTILKGDARELRRLLAPLGIREAAAVVSSLPLISIPKVTRTRILAECFALLGDGRPLIQFTYGPLSPIDRERLGVTGRVAARVWKNLPPASVWRYERRRATQRERRVA